MRCRTIVNPPGCSSRSGRLVGRCRIACTVTWKPAAATVVASRMTRRSLTILLATNIATCRFGWEAPFGTVCGAGFGMRRVYRSTHGRQG